MAIDENLTGAAMDSLIMGLASYVLLQTLFGKSSSLKGLVSMTTLKEGAKLGVANMIYRTAGRPIVNQALQKGGIEVKV